MKKINTEKMEQELKSLNEEYDGIYDFYLDYRSEFGGEPMYHICDHCEEFYYEGCCFDSVFEKVTKLVQETFGQEAFLDCVCPGRWTIAC